MRSTLPATSALALTAILAAVGCTPLYEPLPANQVKPSPSRIPEGAAPVHAWRAETPLLKTYWGDQVFRLECRGYFPASWRRGGDERWEVSCVNQVGTAVPCLGLLYRERNSLGQDTSEVLPPFDIGKLGDGLYLLVDSGVRTNVPAGPDAAPAIAEIRPAAEFVEIRRHLVWPFRIRIPLVPENPSALTPTPEGVPANPAPRGTLIP
jgi:hypothetical protein